MKCASIKKHNSTLTKLTQISRRNSPSRVEVSNDAHAELIPLANGLVLDLTQTQSKPDYYPKLLFCGGNSPCNQGVSVSFLLLMVSGEFIIYL